MIKWFRDETTGTVHDWVLMVAVAGLLVLFFLYIRDFAMWTLS